MMPLVDTKVDVKYKDGGVTMEKIPKAVFTEEFNASWKANNNFCSMLYKLESWKKAGLSSPLIQTHFFSSFSIRSFRLLFKVGISFSTVSQTASMSMPK